MNIKRKASLCKQRAPKVAESSRREINRLPAQLSPRPLRPQRLVLLSCSAHSQHGGIGFLPKTSRELPVPCSSLWSPGTAGFGGLLGYPPHPSVPTTEGTTTFLRTACTKSCATQGVHNRLPSARSSWEIPIHKGVGPQGWSCLTSFPKTQLENITAKQAMQGYWHQPEEQLGNSRHEISGSCDNVSYLMFSSQGKKPSRRRKCRFSVDYLNTDVISP